MSFFSSDIVDQVESVARIRYIARQDVKLWNDNRKDGELRLLSGWMWTSKADPNQHQQGLKTMSAAIRDAYYVLIQHSAAPPVTARRMTKLRAVA